VLPDMVADDRQVSQSGKPLCTGSSLWAVPKLARGRVSAPLRSGAGLTSPGRHAPPWNPGRSVAPCIPSR
jgi:hypothetical protein